MRKIFTFLAISIVLFKLQAQTITTVENVYGGRILGITSSSIAGFADSANVFVTTESANTAFYAKANGITTGAVNISSFTKMPALTAAAGVGSGVQKIASYSNYMYYMGGNTIYKTAFNSSTISNTRTFGFFDTSLVDFTIKGNRLWYFFKVFSSNQDRFAYSDLDVNGSIINYVSPHGYNNTVYPTKSIMSYNLGDSILVFKQGNDPELTILENISTGATAFVHDNLSTLNPLVNWRTAAIAPDGTIFIGGHSATHKYMAYKQVGSATWSEVNTGINGVSGSNIAFYANTSSNYYVYFGSAYSNSKGVAASWNNLGNTSFETHSNDGASLTLANSFTSGVVLFTTDEGLGWTKNAGSIIKEINTGIEAVQVSDFDMRSAKDFGWLASKAGVRFVRNYNTPSKTWSNAMFPNGDGSPYYSAEMIGNDSNSVYVGNLRIYKTTNKGVIWNQVFTPENAPYNFPSVGTQASAIAVSDSINNIVLAGFKIQGTQRGGVFVSTNGGASWSQLLINATSAGFDVDVNDIEIVSDSGRVVAYIGVEYDSSLTTPLRGMYKAQWNGTSWSVRAEEIYTPTTSLINVTDIVIHSKDTILACGGFYNKVYGREYGINFMVSRPVFNTWRSYVPSVARYQPFSAAAWNGDTLFYAYRDSILYSRIFFSSTGTGTPGEALYSKVDNGTEINVLYYDELLAGSGTGFRSIKGASFLLPYKTIDITANINNSRHVDIKWTNNFDELVAAYELQGSCTGNNFENVATISSSNTKQYSYLDNINCTNNWKLYRLMIIEKNGNVYYTSTIKVGNQLPAEISVYPNPTNNGIVQLNTTLKGKTVVHIYNLLGKLQAQFNLNNIGVVTLNMQHLQKGIYVMQLQNEQRSYTQKLVIQ
jgi:hypothetical protein